MKKLDIKRALSEHNMTQADLNQKIGMSPQAICMIIKNDNPTVAKLTRLPKASAATSLTSSIQTLRKRKKREKRHSKVQRTARCRWNLFCAT